MKIASDILLVIPIRSGYSGITIDLGLLYLHGALKDHGMEATLLHCPKENFTDGKWEELLSENRHIKIIGFKTYSVDHNSVKRMCAIAKKVLPNSITIAGGPHSSSVPEYVLSDIPHMDYVFIGEGEVGFPEFCQRTLKGKGIVDVPGLCFRSDKEISKNSPWVVEDLDTLPRIRWEDLNIDEYPDFFTSLPFIPIMATRGCPYHCKYCAGHTIVGRKMRFRSPENVIAELRHLKEVHGVTAVNFSDDELTLNRKYFVAFCEALIREKLEIRWECSNGVRLDTIDKEILDLMYQAGCRYAAIGIESASDKILASMKKNITTATIREKIALIKQSKIVPQGLFMMGFPGETVEDVLKTIEFSIELDIDKTNFSIFMPLPGSEIFDELSAAREIRLNEIDWDKMKPDQIVYKHPLIPPKILKSLQQKAYRSFYFRPKPLYRLLREFIGKKGAIKFLGIKIKSVFGR